MKKCFATRAHTVSADLALLFARVVMGYAFILHGWGKIQNPFQWMGPDATMPGFLQALAALSEFGGGIALIVGLLTKLGALGIGCSMLVAVSLHRFVRGDPFVGREGSYELPLVFLTIALLLLTVGPGRFSLDRLFFGKKE